MPRIRGEYRTINASLVDDPDFQKLTPDQRALFYSLRLCVEYGIAGIWRFYWQTLQIRSGLTEARGWTPGQFRDQLDQLVAGGWIEYDADRSVVWIVDGLQWDPFVDPSNDRQFKGILSQLRALPKTRLLERFMARYQIEPPADLAERVAEIRKAESSRDSGLDNGSDTLSLFGSRNESMDTETSLILNPILNPIPNPRAGGKPPSRAERDRAREEQGNQIQEQIVVAAGELEAAAAIVAGIYLDETAVGIERYYDQRGGQFTPTRRLAWLRSLDGLAIRAILGSLEIYVDKYAGEKDERFQAGIARRLDKELKQSPDEVRKSFERHRATHKGGVYANALETLSQGGRE